ncbi:RNA polymerase sigma factor [Cohnella rhizosphaerae]|uniref:RNA polymerase sigma factor n=1 Tax=Cohnella rhizosphaerae TaxID=1457232 RepID=A0A9X4KRQ4_9BACL|nr:RNA polymerase sigma factor [Cohnella rhizosphaerae]MDG0809597.1 RNA polymerase sigma factor [Cohnella rhizosphaerae]
MADLEDHDLKYCVGLAADEMADLIAKHWHDVWQYALFLTRREHLAEDVAQDTFVRAMRAIDGYRGDGPFKNWLFRIARNTAFNYRKSAFWRRVTLVGLIPNARGTASAECEYWRKELVNEVWAGVWNLPSKYREPIVLYAHYEWSYGEIAELLGVAEGTVKSRLFRGRAMLAERMKGEELDG